MCVCVCRGVGGVVGREMAICVNFLVTFKTDYLCFGCIKIISIVAEYCKNRGLNLL